MPEAGVEPAQCETSDLQSGAIHRVRRSGMVHHIARAGFEPAARAHEAREVPFPPPRRSAWLESNQRSPAPRAGGVAISPTGRRYLRSVRPRAEAAGLEPARRRAALRLSTAPPCQLGHASGDSHTRRSVHLPRSGDRRTGTCARLNIYVPVGSSPTRLSMPLAHPSALDPRAWSATTDGVLRGGVLEPKPRCVS